MHQHGYATIWAATADDAIRAVEVHQPAAITLDYSLPAREGARLNTGWDVLVELLGDRHLHDIALIMVTGDHQVLDRRLRSQSLPGQVVCVDKSEVGDRLIAAMEQLLGGGREAWGRILLADDDPVFATVVQRLLQARGHEVTVVRSGAECLEHLRRRGEEVRLLLLDLKMPGVSGYDVLREVKALPRTRRPPVLVVTAYAQPEDLRERMALVSGGAVSLLTKEEALANPEVLFSRIAPCLRAA